ncbi:hypothetical protein AC578_2451 [Pseudocercospora eumusae]|uniref:Uncharacterized protein n=1 Tax=Pseudocercospora eumusae TaxID=321146 RepID=A0A139HXN1_9PEZI|nr:hypothetical protein AC578_2451 [Pseudocercospora eumusae]
MPEKPTMNLMLDQGARLCPWCRFPFVKQGGCDHMSCSSCDRAFCIQYALVLENEKGRRAALT